MEDTLVAFATASDRIRTLVHGNIELLGVRATVDSGRPVQNREAAFTMNQSGNFPCARLVWLSWEPGTADVVAALTAARQAATTIQDGNGFW